MNTPQHPQTLRRAIRAGEHRGNTSGLAPGYVQCNIVILPSAWAGDFLRFCQHNPRPCPLLASTGHPGDYTLPTLGDIDIRRDVPSYRVFRDGVLEQEISDISALWRDDLVAFALGCSFSFEEALLADGLEVRNVTQGLNVPMDRTNPTESLEFRIGGPDSPIDARTPLADEQEGISGTSARLYTPMGLAFDGDGNLYIVEIQTGTIRKVKKWW